MNKRRLIPAALWVTAISPLFFASCVDDSYDLSKDIDMTVTIGGNLSIPGSNTEEFTLDQSRDREEHENPEDSVIRVDANGDCRLLKQENGDPETVEIDPVNIKNPACESTRTELNFTEVPGTGTMEAPVKDVTMHFTFEKTDVTTDIVSISSAKVDFNAFLTLHFDQISQNVNEITLKKDFNIKMNMANQTQANNMKVESLDPTNYRIEGQTITFKNAQTIRKGETLRVPVRFLRIQNFPEGQGLYEPGHFLMKTNVIANGIASTSNVHSGNVQVTLINDAELPSLITLDQVTGVFDPEVDITVDPVTVNDVPDFLDEEGNNLDLKNPYIKLSISNETPIDVNLTADIIRFKAGVQDNIIPIGYKKEYNELYPGNDENSPSPEDSIILYRGSEHNPTVSTYYLSRVEMPEVIDEVHHVYNIPMGDRIYDLIKTIPDEIKLENIEAKALNKEYTIVLGNDGATYEVNTEYEINAALQFGEHLQIVYNDTINDWGGDLEDITINTAYVEMDAINGIPLNFSLDAEAIDVNGNVYPNVTVTPEQGTIAAGLKITDNNGTAIVSEPTTSKIQLKIECKSGEMADLDGLIIHLKANSTGLTPEMQDATLNKGMTLKLDNIRIRIEGGVTVDMN